MSFKVTGEIAGYIGAFQVSNDETYNTDAEMTFWSWILTCFRLDTVANFTDVFLTHSSNSIENLLFRILIFPGYQIEINVCTCVTIALLSCKKSKSVPFDYEEFGSTSNRYRSESLCSLGSTLLQKNFYKQAQIYSTPHAKICTWLCLALLHWCCIIVRSVFPWHIYSYPTGLLHRHRGNLMGQWRKHVHVW